MRLAREIITMFLILIGAYLVLVHYTGFAQDIGSVGEAADKLAYTFQGRGSAAV
ncbi:MAG TPA: hypothetical protein VKG78_03310 [Opitutaceae bacterium]|nr:hypothetical protein [Opitutaceae bacterium]